MSWKTNDLTELLGIGVPIVQAPMASASTPALAAAVQMGTACLTCPESAAHALYRQASIAARDDGTRITDAFSGRPARVPENRYVREMAGNEDSFPDFPIPNTLTGPLRKASAEAGSVDFMALFSGQAATLSKSLPAKDLVEALATETEDALSGFGDG